MLLKSADDKSKRLALLEDLQNSSRLDARQKKWLREELSRLRKGIQGERDSAYFLDQYFKGAENHVWIHDLRVVFDGDVAQIDHLVINRGVGMYLIETKNYSGNVTINDSGEFTVEYDGELYGVPSPLEQSRRHARILQRLMERLEITNRTGGPLDCHHVVMFHPKAIIRRPSKAAFDTSNVIKADHFPTWHGKFVEKEFGFSKLLRATANLRSFDTIKEWGEKLIRQHRPANQLDLPDFMKAQPERPAPARASQDTDIDSTAWNGSYAPQHGMTIASPEARSSAAKKLICLHCGCKITFAEGRFCWNNETRFKGGQYCREHQKLF